MERVIEGTGAGKTVERVIEEAGAGKTVERVIEEAGAGKTMDGGETAGRMESGLPMIEGVVEHGRRLGRELGFPTANLGVPEDFPLPDGVYRSRAEIGGRRYDGMSNLGCNPSVGGRERRLETHLFDFCGELYGERLRVELLERIREERKFASVEELRSQIAEDRATILHLLGK